jgi:hypothetical protein
MEEPKGLTIFSVPEHSPSNAQLKRLSLTMAKKLGHATHSSLNNRYIQNLPHNMGGLHLDPDSMPTCTLAMVL